MKDLFFPHRCAMCNRVIETIQCICPTCITNLPRTEEALLRENLTEEPFLHIRNFGVGASFLFFEKDAPVQTLLHRMKYGRFAEPHIGYELAQLAAKEFMEYGFFDDIDVIVPVPLHRKRLKERGFNQAEWIAKGLSDSTHIPMDTTHLLRIRNNAHQAQEQGRDRKKNVEHLFDVNHPEEWYRLHILLVDDIITTGSTLLSCIDALSPVRDAQFSVFAIGKSRTNNSHINVEQ